MMCLHVQAAKHVQARALYTAFLTLHISPLGPCRPCRTAALRPHTMYTLVSTSSFIVCLSRYHLTVIPPKRNGHDPPSQSKGFMRLPCRQNFAMHPHGRKPATLPYIIPSGACKLKTGLLGKRLEHTSVYPESLQVQPKAVVKVNRCKLHAFMLCSRASVHFGPAAKQLNYPMPCLPHAGTSVPCTLMRKARSGPKEPQQSVQHAGCTHCTEASPTAIKALQSG